MDVSLFISKRYFFSRKSKAAVNIIAFISVFSITVATASIVIILSAFNGLQQLVDSLYASFDPDIKITMTNQQLFELSYEQEEKISSIPEIANYSEVLEEMAMLRHDNFQSIVSLKGVDKKWKEVTGIDSMIYEGDFLLRSGSANYCVLGYGVASNLELSVNHNIEPVSVYIPKPIEEYSNLPGSSFYKKEAFPSAVFAISPDFDNKYAIVDIAFIRNLLEKKNKCSAIEVSLYDESKMNEVAEALSEAFGKEFLVKTRYQQNELIYKTNETEKWITFILLIFVLIVASFNVISTLTLILLEKQKDIRTLRSIGASFEQIRKVFFSQGLMITYIGGAIGMFLGFLVYWLQTNIGLLRLEGGIVEFYPMALKIQDYLLIAGTILITGALFSWYPVKLVLKKRFFINQNL